MALSVNVGNGFRNRQLGSYMSVYKRKDNGRWMVHLEVNGKSIRRTIRTARNKSEAMEAEKLILRQIHEKTFGLDALPTFAGFVPVYLAWAKTNKRSWEHDEYHCEVLKRFFGPTRLDKISSFDVERFKMDRLKEKKTKWTKDGLVTTEDSVTRTTVNRHLEVLSKLFTVAQQSWKIDNPCKKVKKFKVERKPYRILTPEEETKLLACLVNRREHLLDIVLLDLHTGLRPSELMKLHVSDVDLANSRLKIENTKTSQARFVPLNTTAVEICSRLLAAAVKKKTPWLFPSPKDPSKHATAFRKAFASAVKEAGLDASDYAGRITPYKIRHTFATRIAQITGGDILAIQRLLGHSNMQTSAIYVHLSEDHLRDVVSKIAKRK
jgi:integrase/recombinase XerD